MNGRTCFEAIRYARRPGDDMQQRIASLGLGDAEPVTAVMTPGDHRIGVLLTHRAAVQAARDQGASSVLVLHQDVLFLDRAREVLGAAAAELAGLSWTLCYLGGWWPVVPEPFSGCRHLDLARNVGSVHAVAYHGRVFDRVLADWPSDHAGATDWVAHFGAIDTYLAGFETAAIVRPVITTVPALLPFEAAAAQQHFTA